MRTQSDFKCRLSLRTVTFAIAAIFTMTTLSAFAQNPPLSLADLLIGLRSKKVTLEERNQILTAAVKERGVTFTTSSEIEQELTATGADASLIAAVRAKSKPVPPVVTATPVPKPVATPVPTPTPPDAVYYQKRADVSLEKGDVDAAVTDYTKAVEMKNDDPSLYVSRGRALFTKKSYDLSVKDFDKAIELSPKTAVAFLNRGASYEKLGDVQKALADYRKAADLDTSNEAAKAEAKRLQDQLDKEAAAKAAAVKPVEVVRPEFLDLGNLTTANAVRLVTPVYTQIARQSRIEGRVKVEVELDVNGEVVWAKATSGPAMLRQAAEDAAKRSKFKPAMFNDLPIKAKGVLTYNFNL